MRALLVIALLCSPTLGKAPTKPGSERWYQERAAAHLGGKMEVKVPDGRVDIVTRTHAIELEFAGKWKNAIGQALWYGMQTNKPAGIVLIIRNDKDRGYAIRLGSVIQANKLPIKVWLYPDDFPAAPSPR